MLNSLLRLCLDLLFGVVALCFKVFFCKGRMQLQNGTFLTVEIEMFGLCENLTDTLLILSISICLKDTKRFDNALTQRFTNTFRMIEKQL